MMMIHSFLLLLAQKGIRMAIAAPSLAISIAFYIVFFTTEISAMTWANTWKDILRGGSTRWKVEDVGVKRQALNYIVGHSSPSMISSNGPLHILCPLSGDDQFVFNAWQEGHSVTSIDIVPDAVAAMRQQFGKTEEDWEAQHSGSTVIWRHKSGRATLYEGDMFADRPELEQQFHAVYDKDSFGAIGENMRSKFCERLAAYTKDDAVVYIEVKNKDTNSPGRFSGPPFHLEKDDLMDSDSFGSDFKHVADLGKVYDLNMGGMTQTAHILRRFRQTL
jgi:hypothetical protein